MYIIIIYVIFDENIHHAVKKTYSLSKSDKAS
jgi:hypothetical protein